MPNSKSTQVVIENNNGDSTTYTFSGIISSYCLGMQTFITVSGEIFQGNKYTTLEKHPESTENSPKYTTSRLMYDVCVAANRQPTIYLPGPYNEMKLTPWRAYAEKGRVVGCENIFPVGGIDDCNRSWTSTNDKSLGLKEGRGCYWDNDKGRCMNDKNAFCSQPDSYNCGTLDKDGHWDGKCVPAKGDMETVGQGTGVFSTLHACQESGRQYCPSPPSPPPTPAPTPIPCISKKIYQVPSGGNCYEGIKQMCTTGDPALAGASAKNVCNINGTKYTTNTCPDLKEGDKLCIDCSNTCPTPPPPDLLSAPICKNNKLNIYGTGDITTRSGDVSTTSNLYQLAKHIFTTPQTSICANSDISINNPPCIGHAGTSISTELATRRIQFVKDFYSWQQSSSNKNNTPPEACAVITAIAEIESRFSDTAQSWDTLCEDASTSDCNTPYTFCKTTMDWNPVGICDPSLMCKPVRGGFGQLQFDLAWYKGTAFAVNELIPTDISGQLTALTNSSKLSTLDVPFPRNLGGGWGAQCASGTGPYMPMRGYPAEHPRDCSLIAKANNPLSWEGLFQSCHASTTEGNGFTETQLTSAITTCKHYSPNTPSSTFETSMQYYALDSCPYNINWI